MYTIRMSKSNTLSKKPIVVVLTVAVVVAFVVTGLVLWSRNASNSAGKNQLGFEAYAPTVLPRGVELKDLTLYRSTSTSEITVRFDTDKDNPQFFITERKSTSEERANANMPDCSPQFDTCVRLTSPEGQAYQIRTSIDDGRQSYNKTISWAKGTTSFWAVSSLQSIEEDDAFWGKMIDGFKPADYTDKPIEIITPSGP